MPGATGSHRDDDPDGRRDDGTAPAVTLFDLDGVLSRRDTMGAVVAHRLRRRPHRLPAVVVLVALARVLPPHGAARPALNRLLVRLALGRLSRERYEAVVGAVAAALVSAGNASAAAREAWDAAARRGPVVVVTATEELLARTYLRAAGLDPDVLVASRIAFTRRPRLVEHVVGEVKVRRLREAGIRLDDAVLHTDSASDLPLARAVRRCGPRQRERAHASGDGRLPGPRRRPLVRPRRARAARHPSPDRRSPTRLPRHTSRAARGRWQAPPCAA
ncbi:haloacid dehalogenase-like hydrolase [Cellulomonas sp. 179-A 9B4 NHS]|uniref:haloacid dehalogenase-like hydrolase n=1 Tax=Cellulomonas sp. 179-A 9B4 NHS TaxID=3142379 RepID=UPI0039A28B78